MKTSALVITLLFFIPFAAATADEKEACKPNRNVKITVPYWPPDSTVKVYFVTGKFTSEQKQILLEALETWTQERNKKGSGIKLVYSGETRGLIDCHGCLTLARQTVYSNERRRKFSFNSLRQNEMGELISAWVGFDSATSSPEAFKELISQALGNSLRLSRCWSDVSVKVSIPSRDQH